MPKEFIYDANYGREAVLLRDVDGTGKTEPVTEILSITKAKVSWSKESQEVSLAVVSDEDPDGFDAEHIRLDRAGINRLVRTLRKARDDAYGRDE